MTYELHPLCTLFPRLDKDELAALREDIKANGLSSPITLYEGQILDGGNRYQACLDAGIEPTFVEYSGTDPVSFVLSANLHRRHLKAGQNAIIVASAQDWAKAQVQGANRHTMKTGNFAGLETVANRAATAGVAERTQRDADKVAKASPELANQVAHGEISLAAAVAQVSGKPTEKPTKPKLEVVVDPEIAALREELAELRDHNEELKQIASLANDDNQSMAVVFEANDQLAAAMAEVKKLREMNRILEERIRGLQNECNAAIRSAASWKRKAEKQAA
jgi:cell division protein FtsB